MKPLRIAHVVCSDGFAGVERYTSTVARELSERGHHVVVIGGHEARTKEALRNSGVTHFAARRAADAAGVLIRRRHDFELVHVHMTAAEAAAVATQMIVRRPIVATRHFAAQRGSTLGGRLARRPIRRALEEQISISRFVADTINEPSVLIPSCVPDAELVEPSEQKSVVLVAQRLEVEKRTEDAVDAWDASGLADSGWELWIAGEGAERRALEQRSRNVSAIRFLGHRTDIESLRRQSGIMLAPTTADAFGLSVAEAMAAGLPVVAADGGGHRETVGAVAPELLYTAGDAGACGRLLEDLANDVDRRRRLGSALRDFQRKELGVERHVDQLVELYERVVGGHVETGTRSGQAT